MIVEFIKKYRLPISLIAGFIALYGLSVYFLFENYIGKPILEVNILTDASLWQFITSLLYTAFFFLLWHTGKKKGNEARNADASHKTALPCLCCLLLLLCNAQHSDNRQPYVVFLGRCFRLLHRSLHLGSVFQENYEDRCVCGCAFGSSDRWRCNARYLA